MTQQATSEAAGVPAWGEGWHVLENEGGQPFRWMGRVATLHLTPLPAASHLELAVKCHFEDLSQHLAVDGLAPLALAHGWNTVSFDLPPGAEAVTLTLDRVLPPEEHPADGRELGVQVRPPRRHADPARHLDVARRHAARVEGTRAFLEGPLARTARDLRFERGFYPPDLGEGEVVRWMACRGALAFPPAPGPRFLELRVRSPFRDGSQSLTVSRVAASDEVALAEGWNHVSVGLEPGTERVEIVASRAWTGARREGDPRELAIQVRAPLLHEDGGRHASVAGTHANRVLNHRELLAGQAVLASRPPRLGIDVAGTCNVKPPCVYCEWETSKAREGERAHLAFGAADLEGYGDFFERAEELVNCSIGEPFMIRGVDALLETIGSRGKFLELTVNGQILTDANVARLLGRDVHLYVSLDAATAATYARLRNDTFPRVLANLERLIAAKGGPGRLPLVYLVFMPMRANVHEVDAFVDLCARLRADRLVLRPLNPSPGVSLVWDRGGYHFDYQAEVLPFPELVRISGRVKALCARAGVLLSDQLDFAGGMAERFPDEYARGEAEGRAAAASDTEGEPVAATPPPEPPSPAAEAPPTAPSPVPTPAPAEEPEPAAPRLPICTEPWASLYVLRRGTMPCCYGGRPVAPMEGFREAWNGPQVVEMRRALAAGRFHAYCFDSPDCPLVRQHEHAHDLAAGQRTLLLGRRLLDRLRRDGYGRPGRAWRLGLHYLRLARARLARLARG